MKLIRLLTILFLVASFSVYAEAQKVSESVKSSAAYAEVILRTTEIESNLEELLVSYTEEFPKVKESRFELKLLEKDLAAMAKMRGVTTRKLTQALGKLMIRRAELQTNHWFLKTQYSDEHPNVKKAKRKLDIFTKAINKILK